MNQPKNCRHKEIADPYRWNATTIGYAVRAKARIEAAPCLLYAKANPLFEYMAANSMTLDKIIVNTRNVEAEIKEEFDGDFEVEVMNEPFKHFGIDEAIFAALEKEVRLKGGSRLFIVAFFSVNLIL